MSQPTRRASATRTPAKARAPAPLSKQQYRETLLRLQVELTKLQKHYIGCADRILVIFEGRDSAGKDGVIKRIVKHLSPRETRVVALGKPSDRERGEWYFQRYVAHLPAPQEFVLFNRSWYNRAGVERVMGFCDDAQYEEFMATVADFERMLIGSGITLLKYYLDISKAEQKARLKARKRDPLKQWKVSPIDDRAVKLWKRYSEARDAMLARTHTPESPWTIVRADDKRRARINLIGDLLARLHYADKDARVGSVDPSVLFRFDAVHLGDGSLAQ
ncbi:MAG: polyphosphate kinase 2 [Pseudomonadota bacterium]